MVALVQRNGLVKSQVIDRVTSKNLKSFIRANVDNTSVVMTDDFRAYKTLRREYDHRAINHSLGRYVDGPVHTNTIEGYFSLLKRRITGVFHNVGKKYLIGYLWECDFRYNMRTQGDAFLTSKSLQSVEGKRLLYRDSSNVA